MATPEDIVGGILDCYHQFQHCIISAVIIRDEQARLKAALKCLTELDDCKEKAVPTTTEDVERLERRLRELRRRK